MEKTIRVLVVDDHAIFRTGVINTLSLEDDIEVTGEAGDGLEALELMKKVDFDIALVDVTMPGMGGVELVGKMEEAGMARSVIALTALEDDRDMVFLSNAGVKGFVLKTSGFDELISAIRTVSGGDNYVDSRAAGKLLNCFSEDTSRERGMSRLSERELEVLYWLAQGLNGQDIAERLSLSDKTVKNHISHILAKLGVSDRTQAVAWAWRSGLASKDPSFFKD
ncbi:MAG: response regulator transcription factor [Synergistota bacterium]|nr:response regulator transcription factor [Synergistota bacterium]